MFFDDDCKNIVMRIVQAYNLTTIKSLCDKWNLSTNVMGSRIQRNTFPYDYVLRCAFETGANPMWLATGKGNPAINGGNRINIDLLSVPRHSLINGKLNLFPTADLDRTMLPDEINQPEVIKAGKMNYIIDKKFEITNGKYVIDIEGSIGVYDLYRVPVNKVVISGSDLPKELELNVNDINVIAKVAVEMREV